MVIPGNTVVRGNRLWIFVSGIDLVNRSQESMGLWTKNKMNCWVGERTYVTSSLHPSPKATSSST